MRLSDLKQRIPLEELRERFKLSSLRQLARRNMALRVLSVLLAISLWMFVNAGQHDAETSIQVPISYQHLPANMLIVNTEPRFIKLDITGPPTLLSLLDPGRLRLRLNLAGVNTGEASFKVTSGMFAIPPHTSITGITPSEIVLDIDKIVTREVPVRLPIEGPVAAGYTITATEVTPAVVQVTGPSTYVWHLAHVDTAPFDVKGATTVVQRSVDLISPGNKVRVAASTVQAKVTVAEVIADREFRGIPIEVRDSSYKFRIEPRQVNVTVRGPWLKLSSLDLKASAYVDADGVTPGYYELPVEVSLPDGVELMRQEPEKVRLRMYRQRRSSNG
jgi:YbbR domain-containing protein